MGYVVCFLIGFVLGYFAPAIYNSIFKKPTTPATP